MNFVQVVVAEISTWNVTDNNKYFQQYQEEKRRNHKEKVSMLSL